MNKRIVFLLMLALLVPAGHSQVRGMKKSSKPSQMSTTSIQRAKNRLATLWVDSVMSTMTLRQQVAQLMIIRVPLNLEGKAQREFEQVIRETEVGGVCFFVGTAEKTLPLIKRFQ